MLSPTTPAAACPKAQAFTVWAKSRMRPSESSTTSTVALDPHSLATRSAVPCGTDKRPLCGRFAASDRMRAL
ncbi:hypothetical protein D3C86_1959830 [compost metagenome]